MNSWMLRAVSCLVLRSGGRRIFISFGGMCAGWTAVWSRCSMVEQCGSTMQDLVPLCEAALCSFGRQVLRALGACRKCLKSNTAALIGALQLSSSEKAVKLRTGRVGALTIPWRDLRLHGLGSGYHTYDIQINASQPASLLSSNGTSMVGFSTTPVKGSQRQGAGVSQQSESFCSPMRLRKSLQ